MLDNKILLKNYQSQFNDGCLRRSIEHIDLLYPIGLCLMKEGNFTEALENLLQAKQIIIAGPASWYRFPQLLSTLYDNIAQLYLFLNDYRKALIM
jgi:tetratricopeptide (TPR) repeat protein